MRPEPEKPRQLYTTNHAAVSLVSIAGVWLLAFILYIILRLCSVPFAISFVIACPVTAVLLIVFNSLWGNRNLYFWFVSLLVWSILFLICYAARAYNLWLLMTVGFPAMIVVWFSCHVRSPKTDGNNHAQKSE